MSSWWSNPNQKAKERKPESPTLPRPTEPDFSGGYAPGAPYQNPYIDPRLGGLTDFMRGERDKDISGGMDWASKYFGTQNPEMKRILDTRYTQAFGLDPATGQPVADRETQLAREAGSEGINRQVQTALRQFQGRLPGTGVRGGAAGAMAGMMTRDSLAQTRGLERDLALNEMQRRREALGNYEKSLTGERAGLLSSAFGMASLGSQDRYGGLQFLLGKDWLDYSKGEAAGGGGGDGQKPLKWWQKGPFNDSNDFNKKFRQVTGQPSPFDDDNPANKKWRQVFGQPAPFDDNSPVDSGYERIVSGGGRW
jgi:hypothetical protein